MDLKYLLFSLAFGLIAGALLVAGVDGMGPGLAFTTAAFSFACGVFLGLASRRRTAPERAEELPRSSLD